MNHEVKVSFGHWFEIFLYRPCQANVCSADIKLASGKSFFAFSGSYNTRGSLCDSSDQKCDWCDWCDLWLAFNFGPWFFFVIDVIGVIDVISVIDVIGVIFVIDVIQLSQNMIWRTQFYGFLYFLSSLVFFCCATSENFHLLKL